MAEELNEAQLTARKVALLSTVNSAGWPLIRQLADARVKQATDEALDEEDSSKRDAKVLKASALRKGFAQLFVDIEAFTKLDLTAQGSDVFDSLEFEVAAEK
jgi:hypothetical protein